MFFPFNIGLLTENFIAEFTEPYFNLNKSLGCTYQTLLYGRFNNLRYAKFTLHDLSLLDKWNIYIYHCNIYLNN